MDTVDCVVIGAGVVGLACAREMALAGHEVVVLEAALAIGTETSSRNSEVVHGGLYYPPGSLKATACVDGRRRLYDYCDLKKIPYNRCGKLIVATSDAEAEVLARIMARAEQNGVEAMAWMTPEQVTEIEPEIRCVTALFSGETGVIDSHAYMLALQGDLEDAGGVIAFGARVVRSQVVPGGVTLTVRMDDGEETEILARQLITNAGLHAQTLLETMEGFPVSQRPVLRYAKGNYFACSATSPFKRLIYPAPEPGGLGVHVTFDLGGQLRFGPDVEWVETLDYAVDPDRSQSFYAAIRKYWPGLPDNSIHPAYSGIRPKLMNMGEPADFVIQGPAQHGVPGLVNMLGIESPGLTASLSLASSARDALSLQKAQTA